MRDLLIDSDLLFLKHSYLVFVRSNQCRVFIPCNTLEEMNGLAVKKEGLLTQGFRVGFDSLAFGIPEVRKHGGGHKEDVLRRLQIGQQALKVPFDLFTADRLPIALAALRSTEVVRILAVASRGPASRHRLFTAGADNKTSQWEVLIDVQLCRGFGLPVEAVLYLAVGLIADKGFVPALDHRQPPFGFVDVACIKNTIQHIPDL